MTAAPFKGFNSLTVSPATMKQVMQAWINEQFETPVKVNSVEQESSMKGSDFTIRFEQAPDQETTE